MSEFNMSGKDWDKIINYAHIAWEEDKSEIGGMMIATKENGEFLLSDPVILKQKVSMGNTILDKEALAKYYAKTAISHGNKDIIFVWWHSHHTMSAFWSGTDLATIDTTKSGSVSMSLVVNLKEEYLFRVNLWEPIEAHKDVEINIIRPERKIPKALYNDYEKLVSDIVVSKPKIKDSKYRISNNNPYVNKWMNGYDNTAWSNWETVPELITDDNEFVQLEADLDNRLQEFYTGEITYKQLKKKVKSTNKKLMNRKSELRVDLPEEEVLDTVMSSGYFDRNDASKLIVCNNQGKLDL